MRCAACAVSALTTIVIPVVAWEVMARLQVHRVQQFLLQRRPGVLVLPLGDVEHAHQFQQLAGALPTMSDGEELQPFQAAVQRLLARQRGLGTEAGDDVGKGLVPASIAARIASGGMAAMSAAFSCICWRAFAARRRDHTKKPFAFTS
jgi:hypothetical protein